MRMPKRWNRHGSPRFTHGDEGIFSRRAPGMTRSGDRRNRGRFSIHVSLLLVGGTLRFVFAAVIISTMRETSAARQEKKHEEPVKFSKDAAK